MDNLSKLKKLQTAKKEAINGGGEAKIKKQHDAKKKTARERMSLLFDEGTFIEIDSFLKTRNVLSSDDCYADGVVAGYGTVDGRLIYGYAQDFTVLGGALGEMNIKKIMKVLNLAKKTGAPVVSMIDCGGVRLEEGADALCEAANLMGQMTEISGVVPQVCMVLGPCAGTMSFIPAVSDFVFMVDEISSLYITSKEVIKGATNESDANFPNALFNAENNTTNFVAKTEEECFCDVKNLLSFLPSNFLEESYSDVVNDDLNRATEDIINIIPNDENSEFDMIDIIKTVADNCNFFEVSKENAKNMVTGFIRLNGATIGVVANQPKENSGLIDGLAAKKASAFIGKCDSFNIPVLSFVDSAGYKVSLADEKWGMVNDIAKLGFAFSNANVPKVNVIVRKAYGGAFALMNSKQMGADFAYALPTAIISATTPEIAVNVLYDMDIKKAVNPQGKRAELMEKYKDEDASAFEVAKRGYIDDIIDPATLRPVLISAFDVLLTKRVEKQPKKHGNYPV